MSYVKHYLDLIVKRSIYFTTRINDVFIETNIYKLDENDQLKIFTTLKMITNTLNKGEVYHLDYIKVQIVIETYIKSIDKYYHIKLFKNNNLYIVFNEIQKYECLQPRIIEFYKLGYTVFKNQKDINCLKELNLKSIDKWMDDVYIFKYYMKSAVINYVYYYINPDNNFQMIKKIDDDRKIDIKYQLDEPLIIFYKKCVNPTSVKFYVIRNDKESNNEYFEMFIKLDEKLYYIKNYFTEIEESDFNTLTTKVLTKVNFNLYQMQTYEDFGLIRSKGIYKLLNPSSINKNYENGVMLL